MAKALAIATLNQQYYTLSFFLRVMLTHAGMLRLTSEERECECSMVGPKTDCGFEEGMFLVGLKMEKKGKQESSSNAQPIQRRARKSLKAQRGDKENLPTNDTSLQFKQTNTCFSSNYFLEQPSTTTHHPILHSNHSQRSPLLTLTAYQSNCNLAPDTAATQTLFEVKKLPTAANQPPFTVKPLNVRFIPSHPQKGEDLACGSKVRENVKLDRAQSSDNLTVPKLMLPGLKEKGEWRSQFVNLGEESNSKRTHRLTELQVKYTESIHDSQSLEISQVVSLSESESSRSESNRTETFVPRRMRDLLHMKYSKVQGRKH